MVEVRNVLRNKADRLERFEQQDRKIPRSGYVTDEVIIQYIGQQAGKMKTVEERPSLQHILVETTTRCNLRCVHCMVRE
jgi:hypothetical protein